MNSSFNHFVNDSDRFAFVESLSAKNFFFFFDVAGRNFFLGNASRFSGCDLKSHVVDDFCGNVCACFDQNADFAAHVNVAVEFGIGSDHFFIATNADFFADFGDCSV